MAHDGVELMDVDFDDDAAFEASTASAAAAAANDVVTASAMVQEDEQFESVSDVMKSLQVGTYLLSSRILEFFFEKKKTNSFFRMQFYTQQPRSISDKNTTRYSSTAWTSSRRSTWKCW